MPRKIVVIGSLNMDFFVHVERLPQPGETILGSSFEMLPGGKGANQAYTVARLGGNVGMIGCVGQDIFGQRLINNLKAVGVETSRVLETSNGPTGIAFISVEKSGQNQIVVAPGANENLDSGHIMRALSEIRPDYILLQLEIPLSIVECAILTGRKQNAFLVLDPAPAKPIDPRLLSQIDILTPNESEALFLLGRIGNSISIEEAADVVGELLKMGPRQVILKLGKNGVWYADEMRNQHFPARTVQAIDATAAGDTFNGALCVAMAEGKSIDEAILFANYAASLSVTKQGAQASIPTREEVDTLCSDCGQRLP
jgi:ribokinase